MIKKNLFWRRICLIPIVLTLLMPLALAEIQISLDNSSWVDASYYGLEVYVENGTILVDGLDPDTTYYFRAKNSSTDWGYTSIERTNPGGVDKVAIAIVLGLVGIIAVLLYISKTISHKPLKLFIFFIVWLLILFSITMMQQFSTDAEVSSNLSMIYQICLWAFVFITFYIVIMFIKNAVVSARKRRAGIEEEEEEF